jgi:hypothetical protein
VNNAELHHLLGIWEANRNAARWYATRRLLEFARVTAANADRIALPSAAGRPCPRMET